MSKCLSKRPFVAATLLLGVCLGCGTGEYESRLDETVKRIREKSEFATDMHPPRKVAQTAVWCQVPKNFAETPLWEKSPGKEIEERNRVQLPENLNSSTIPELQQTYEGWFSEAEEGPESEENPKTAFYCYLSVTDLSTSITKDPMRTLRNNLGGVGYGVGGDKSVDIKTEDVLCETAEGRFATWLRSEYLIKSPLQDFYVIDKENNGQFVPKAGTLVFYSRTDKAKNLTIVVGFRVPTEIWNNKDFPLKERAALVPGTVKIDEPD